MWERQNQAQLPSTMQRFRMNKGKPLIVDGDK